MKGINLEFPIIMYFDDVLVVDNGEGFRAMGASFPDQETMLCKESVRKHNPGWILEVNGKFRELKPKGKRFEWTRPLSFLWRFVLSEYKVFESRSVSVGELKSMIDNLDDKFPEAPLALDLRRYLKTYKEDVVITEEILKKWPI